MRCEKNAPAEDEAESEHSFQKEGMTMRGKWVVAGLLAAVGVLAWGGWSRGGDIIRLDRVDDTPTRDLVDNGQGADTIRMWHHGYGWGGWGGWGYRGLGWGGWGYRGLGWGGFYRPYWGLGGFYRPYWGWGGWGLYRPFYGFGPGYGLGFGGLGYGLGFFGPCAGVSASAYTLNLPAFTFGLPSAGLPQANAPAPAPAQPRNDGTFPYDGGPSNPIPNPKDTPPSSIPQRSLPLEGRAVSLPKAAPKWAYPAYGERAQRTTRGSERTYLTRSKGE